MCIILLVICLFSGISSICSVSEVQFTIEALNDDTLACKQTLERPWNATVLENEDMKLSVKFGGRKPNLPPFIHYFQCVRENNSSYVVVKNPMKSPSISVPSVKATKQMSGLWVCRILLNKDAFIKPVKYEAKPEGYFTELFCHVNVHVRLLETPQMVLVNNMIIQTERMDYTEKDVDHSAVYNYLNGDIVTVACIPGNKILKENTENLYNIEFQYSYAENLDEMFKQLKNIRNKLGFGFRTKLRTGHHKSEMICKLHGQDDHTTIKVTFVQKNMIESTGHITVNGLIARPLQSAKNDNDLGFKLNYLFFEGQNVEIVCEGKEDSLRAAGNQEECKTGGKTFTQQLKTPFEYNCFLCNDGIIYNNINVVTKGLASNFKEHERLDVDLPRDKILIELFNYDEIERHSWIYYEFES